MKKEMFSELLQSVREAAAISKGRKKPSRTFDFKNPDIKAIRNHLHLTQSQFAELLGISLGTLRNWEQSHRKPHGPARILLAVAAIHPEALLEVAKLKG